MWLLLLILFILIILTFAKASFLSKLLFFCITIAIFYIILHREQSLIKNNFSKIYHFIDKATNYNLSKVTHVLSSLTGRTLTYLEHLAERYAQLLGKTFSILLSSLKNISDAIIEKLFNNPLLEESRKSNQNKLAMRIMSLVKRLFRTMLFSTLFIKNSNSSQEGLAKQSESIKDSSPLGNGYKNAAEHGNHTDKTEFNRAIKSQLNESVAQNFFKYFQTIETGKFHSSNPHLHSKQSLKEPAHDSSNKSDLLLKNGNQFISLANFLSRNQSLISKNYSPKQTNLMFGTLISALNTLLKLNPSFNKAQKAVEILEKIMQSHHISPEYPENADRLYQLITDIVNQQSYSHFV
ncbi:hypothetical protein [Rickettsiales endosymbiont of Stachyamoeba lipophora]|uniref:hypothetical protein n=1 Tax=Rickettsiales endosymbiont of Stachyamoeba lipophora TaxID=2486578 RepID=UPI000F6475C6|nr:hypothetical protein [Rickettsiales endosymbiont of Stachyamoeba lipophora]AZL15685.1 hypothetical protein EF513_03860 [Rickettsiales endosymbiont of Stachyamoeba lipophora]